MGLKREKRKVNRPRTAFVCTLAYTPLGLLIPFLIAVDAFHTTNQLGMRPPSKSAPIQGLSTSIDLAPILRPQTLTLAYSLDPLLRLPQLKPTPCAHRTLSPYPHPSPPPTPIPTPAHPALHHLFSSLALPISSATFS